MPMSPEETVTALRGGSDADAAHDARVVAAMRVRDAAQPVFGRHIGPLTYVPEAVVGSLRNRLNDGLNAIPNFVNNVMARRPGSDLAPGDAVGAMNAVSWPVVLFTNPPRSE